MCDRLTSRPLQLSAVLTLVLGLQVLAQGSASIVLTSGERQPAQNIGLFDGRELIVRTSMAEEPRFPIDQVAYIDFGGGPDARPRFNGARHALQFRDGRVLRGEVTRIAHTTEDQKSPFLITVRTTNGAEQQVNGNDVSRVYFSETPGNTSAGQSNRGFRRGNRGIGARGNDPVIVTVSARQRWTPTGIIVNRGETIGLQTSGQVRLNGDGVTASADGGSGNDPASPLPGTLVGALIGRIGNGQPFGIGSQTSISAPDSGPLFLGVNDSQLNDNDGAFRVEIRLVIQ